MKTIHLHGILAKRFGRLFKLDVQSAKEACHALACQIPAFKQFMLDSERLGYHFAVFNGKKRNQKTNISEKDLDSTTTANHIHIVPRIIGSGGKAMGWLQVIAGAVMIGVGVFTFGATTAWGAALIGAGAGLMVGGVSSLLMPMLEQKLMSAGITPLYAFSKRVSVEHQKDNGEVVKQNIFKHVGFVGLS